MLMPMDHSVNNQSCWFCSLFRLQDLEQVGALARQASWQKEHGWRRTRCTSSAQDLTSWGITES